MAVPHEKKIIIIVLSNFSGAGLMEDSCPCQSWLKIVKEFFNVQLLSHLLSIGDFTIPTTL